MRLPWICVSCLALGIVSLAGPSGCTAADANGPNKPGAADVGQQVDEEFGPLDQEAIDGFEQELQTQYQQLYMTYDEYDAVRSAPDRVTTDDGEAHRIHKKLKRRHRTLARLHEDRMWLYIDDEDGPSARDRQLAEAHRAAAHWHEDRFEENGTGVERQDSELKALRREFERAEEVMSAE